MKSNISFNRFIDSLRNEQSNYIIALLIICCLSILLVTTLVMEGYDIVSLVSTSRDEIDKISALHISSSNNVISSVSASRWDFFGTSAVAESAAPGNYALLGIEYTANDPAHAKAIISTNSEEAELYGVGDKLGSGTVIDRIDTDKVILLHNGVRQVLSLSWEGESGINNQQGEDEQAQPALPPNPNAVMEQMNRLRQRLPGARFRPFE
jgi:type II secretory pathway component PulC